MGTKCDIWTVTITLLKDFFYFQQRLALKVRNTMYTRSAYSQLNQQMIISHIYLCRIYSNLQRHFPLLPSCS